MLLPIIALPLVQSLTCHQLDWWERDFQTSSNCTGTACATFIGFERAGIQPKWSQGCIKNVPATPGCWEYPKSTLCICMTDHCNVDEFGDIAEIKPVKNSTCPINPKCADSFTCLFTTDRTMNPCLLSGAKSTLHELFVNTVLIDKTFKPNGTKGDAKSSITAVCDNDKCMKLAEKLSSQKNFTSTKKQVACYSYSDTPQQPFELNLFTNITANNHSCTGDYCYMSINHDQINRGCLTVVDDSMAEVKMKDAIYEFVNIHFYLCSKSYCNLEDISQLQEVHPPIANATAASFGTTAIMTVAVETTTATVTTSSSVVEATTKSSYSSFVILSALMPTLGLMLIVLSTCKGEACGTYFDNVSGAPSWKQGCINNLNITAGCVENPTNTLCACTTDLCNKDKSSDFPVPTKPRTSACPKTDFCSEIYSCMFTTDIDIDQCMLSGNHQTLFEFYTGMVFLDRTFTPNSKKGVVKSSITAHCDSDKCMKLAKKLSTQKNFTRLEDQVSCYSYQDSSEYHFELNTNASMKAQNQSCTGDFCYMSFRKDGLQQTVARGCLTALDDSLATTHIESGTYAFINLHFYLCKENYCNLRDVQQINGQSPPIATTTPKIPDSTPIVTESIGTMAVSAVTTISTGEAIASSAATVIIGGPVETTSPVVQSTTKATSHVLKLVPIAAIITCMVMPL